jgi:hypothetical protein
MDKEGLKGLYSHLYQRVELSMVFITEKIKPVKQTIGELFTSDLIEEETNVVQLFPADTQLKVPPPDPRPPTVRILSEQEVEALKRKEALMIYDQDADQPPSDDEVE